MKIKKEKKKSGEVHEDKKGGEVHGEKRKRKSG